MKIPEFSSQKEKKKFFQAAKSYEEKIRLFALLLKSSRSSAFLGGAGVSTESGIPDFRGKDGLYKKRDRRFSRYQPEYLLSSECLSMHPEVFFSYCRAVLDPREVSPNRAHQVLAKMEKAGVLSGVITQNIDGLHQKAGSEKVCEIHGTMLESRCVFCQKEFGPDFIYEDPGAVPKCPDCGHMVRPLVTLYGEFLPRQAYDQAVDLVNRAELLIVGGTSLEVGSASQLAHLFHGPFLVIINRGKTKLCGRADLVFRESIGQVLTDVWAEYKKT